MIILVPEGFVHRLADMIEFVEDYIQEAKIDIELSSLEDAFIKIFEQYNYNKCQVSSQEEFSIAEKVE